MPDNLFTDGLLLASIAALYLALLLVRVLRKSPPSTGPILLAIVTLGAGLRLLISQEALLTAWTYTRVVPLAKAIANGPLIGALAQPMFLTDLIFNTNLVLAALTPIPLFLHANFLLKDTRMALAAAGLLAILPVHITFSRSDVYFMQSLCFSSLAFATMYSALTDTSKSWRIGSLLFLVPLLLSVFLARPLNLIFYPLLLATIFVTVGPDIPSDRRKVAALMITIPAVLDLGLNLFAGYSTQIKEGLGLRTLLQAFLMLFDLRRNTVINPFVTPTLVLILSGLGLRHLWRNGKQPIALYLAAWLGVFFVTHAYIYPFRTTMMARYHLHLVTPVVLMAAAATPLVLRLPTWGRSAVALYLLACPVLHLSFEQDVRFSIQREFEFLTSLRERVDGQCTVVELGGSGDCVRGTRAGRVAARVAADPLWQARQLIGSAPEQNDRRQTPRGTIEIAEIDKRVDAGECVLFYEGNLCRAFGTSWNNLAPECKTMHTRYRLEKLAEQEYNEYVYDPADARGGCAPAGDEPHVRDGEVARLRLYRILSSAESTT